MRWVQDIPFPNYEGEVCGVFVRYKEVMEDVPQRQLKMFIQIYGSKKPVVVRHLVVDDCRNERILDEAWFIDGQKVTPLEVKTEEAVETVHGGKARFRITYVELPGYDKFGGRFILKKYYLSWVGAREVSARIPVWFEYVGDKLYAGGQTYHIRDHLKKLGFKWNNKIRIWEKKTTAEEAKKIVEQIRQIKDVFIESVDWRRAGEKITA